MDGSSDRELRAAAVFVREAHHGYRRFPFDTGEEAVLKGVDMTVRCGEVYALLGRSGSGKTTLLRALVGQHSLNAGRVLVFGRTPGDPEGGVPGSAVGYMPQEVAVHDGFTIRETLCFYGRLVGMSSSDIRESTEWLVDVLHLPVVEKLIGALSGGEKRRLSLAIALLHSPPLLILDEPTVGADPVLRQSIWQLLLALAATGTTVVISTHYIEEARRAHMVGLLRSGCMAVEDCPDAILSRCGDVGEAGGLEAAVRRLCTILDEGRQPDQIKNIKDEREMASALSEQNGASSASISSASHSATCEHPQRLPSVTNRAYVLAPLQTRNKLRALLWKDCIYLWRHGALLAAQALFFVFITVLACVVLGHWPEEVRVDVVNEEANCEGEGPSDHLYSCSFIAELPRRGMRPVLREDVDSARTSVLSGMSWGVLHFGSNFTEALVQRVVEQSESEDTLLASEVNAHLDMTDYVVSNMIRKRVMEIMDKTVSSLSPSVTDLIKFEQPIFGKPEPVNTDTLMPGVLLGYMTTFAASLVMSTLLTEKLDKFMERTLVAGVTMCELMACWVVVLFPVVLLVNLASHLLVFGTMAVPCAGSAVVMYMLCTALCIMTMLAGLLFASVFDNYLAAILACHQFAVSFLFLSGVLWPLQAMHWSLRWLALVMPWAYSMEAARAVLQRGWGLQHMVVWLAFGSCLVWMGLFLAALVFVHRPRRINFD